ncbi:MAG TPA: TMEM165/GDT1 family protein [Burkholderiales bacterium]|nr:TMEM165/GDT1 family protein [Burkholderiales bacterium]
MLEAFFVSTLAVTIGEIGDKTQLLAFILATRFRKPVPIVLGILVATLANHAVAGLAGNWIREALEPDTLRWGLGASFLGIAAWAVKPDKLDEAPGTLGCYGVFMCSLVAFFLAEIGDKTQLATIALAAKYEALVAVVGGTTLGMLFANAPVVFLADKAAAKIPFKAIRYSAAVLFAILGGAVLMGFELT